MFLVLFSTNYDWQVEWRSSNLDIGYNKNQSNANLLLLIHKTLSLLSIVEVLQLEGACI